MADIKDFQLRCMFHNGMVYGFNLVVRQMQLQQLWCIVEGTWINGVQMVIFDTDDFEMLISIHE